MRGFISQFRHFGFSGSRGLVSGSASAVRLALRFLPRSAVVSVGCASGIDALLRSSLPSSSLHVFYASSFGSGRSSFARRSAACVQHVASHSGLWVSFPSSSCPAGLVPSACSRRCFCGLGSGSWASLALAVGLGIPCLVWLPSGVLPPAWGFRSLHFTTAGGSWWVI